MAENTPTSPGGALPPRPAEASKVQPKKETVRINLPPKPTSAPTIKLPTLAPGVPASGGAPAAPAAAAATTAAAPAAARVPAPPTPPSGAPATRIAAPAPARPAAAPVAPRPVAPMAGSSALDKGLAIAAAVAGLAALGCVLYLAYFLKDTVPS
jgi:hypothetical protein